MPVTIYFVCLSAFSNTGSKDCSSLQTLADRLCTDRLVTLIAKSEGESVGSDSPEAVNST